MLACVVTACALCACSAVENVPYAIVRDNAAMTIPNEDIITLKMFTSLPDRTCGAGLVEQMLIDEYTEANPNIKIEVEALDEAAYKIKFKAYAMEGLPDIVNIWGQPSFIDEVLKAGILAELNEDDYADYKFVNGSLDGFKKNGKLYGLPRNTDVQLIFYNKELFDAHNWNVPDTYDELLELCKEIRAAEYIPMAMDGEDGWPLAYLWTDIMVKLAGEDYSEIVENAMDVHDFTAHEFVRATYILHEMGRLGMFQKNFESSDYGSALSLFTSGRAAMFCTGSWDCALALNEDIDPKIRTNIRAFTFPMIEGGKGSIDNIAAWNGGGYAVSNASPYKEEAIKFLNYIYRPDKLSKYGWENGVGMSAQDQSSYLTGDETELQLQVMNIVRGASSVSGNPVSDYGPAEFKSVLEDEIPNVSHGSLSIGMFLGNIGHASR